MIDKQGESLEERRIHRKQISADDQEFLNSVREKYGRESGRRNFLGKDKLQSFLRIRDKRLVGNLFRAIDDDRDGKISETDVLNTVTRVILGSDGEKIKFLFAVHDGDGDGYISQSELDHIFKASLNQSSFHISPRQRKEVLKALLKKAGARKLDLPAFRKLLNLDPQIRRRMLDAVSLWFGYHSQKEKEKGRADFRTILRYIFVVFPYKTWRVLLVLAYIGANVWFFSQAVLRYRAAGANIYIQIARGAGACLNLNGMLILLPMMRTLITWIRKTFLFVLIPVDENIEIHKITGRVFFFFAILHSAAHISNYLTSGADLKNRLLVEPVGLTGVIAMGAFLLVWLFSLNFIRRSSLYEWFSTTHLLYWIIFPVLMIHVRTFFLWTIIPVSGFLLELIIRKFLKSQPSFIEQSIVHDIPVTELKIHRPRGFRFQAGEYIFLKIPAISRFGWHPFTISSAPEQEETISVHIRALGNWTRRLYSRMKTLSPSKRRLPVKLQGPYGSPSIRIFNSKVAVLIGAGIGVTPFTSILESIVLKKKNGTAMNLEKVYFYWIYRGQETFRWVGDQLAEIEKRNMRMLDLNIYLTDALIDPLNGLIKIGMDLTGKANRTDALTGLKSKTNFGRPDWNSIFAAIAGKNSLKRVNVFYCGPYLLGDLIRKEAHRKGFHFRMEKF